MKKQQPIFATCVLEIKDNNTWRIIEKLDNINTKNVNTVLNYLKTIGDKHYTRYKKCRTRQF